MNDRNNLKCHDEKPINQAILNSLQIMQEKILTQEILIPLFYEMGYYKVDYHGGVYEGGKDLICWKLDELGFTELAVVQVKLWKLKAAASSSKSFGAIVTQLQQAAETEVPHTDGSRYLPTAVYFCTPFEVNTRALESRFEAYASLKQRRVKIIDGPLLVSLIRDKLPKLGLKLAGKKSFIREIVIRELTNTDLLKALNLGLTGGKNLSSFYCDLDFGVGQITSRLFFSMSFEPSQKAFLVRAGEWENLKPSINLAQEFFGDKIVSPSINRIESSFEKQRKDQVSAIEALQEVSRQIDQLLSSADSIERETRDRRSSLFESSKTKLHDMGALISIYEEYLSEMINLRNTAGMKTAPKRAALQGIVDNFVKLGNSVKSLEVKLFKKQAFLPNTEVYVDQTLKAINLSRKKTLKSRKLDEPVAKLKLDGRSLAKRFREKQLWLEQETQKSNIQTKSAADLREFLLKCKELFHAADKILGNPYLADVIGLTKSQAYADLSKMPRLSMSIHAVFDTGLNLALLGSAGAGKTTTLQVYAHRKLTGPDTEGLTLFLPLARAFSNFNPIRTGLVGNYVEIIESQIASYFISLGVDTTKNDVLGLLRKKNVVLLLDGIDEIADKATWILDAVDGLSQKYHDIQIVASSRMSGEYLRKMPFLGITLLPFTDEQRAEFIRGWFDPASNVFVNGILEHLERNPEISEIVRNPLLATVLCALAEHGVPLPDSEIRLYEERMRLLLGHYDIHKHAIRLKSHASDLEIVARKIAYSLHKSSARSKDRRSLLQMAFESLRDRMKKENIERALDELIDPCNVLVPMTEDGKFGFGHLRYQEYLVACELKHNRGIQIGKQIYQDWWRGALVLFAQLADSIEFVFEWLAYSGNYEGANDTVQAMLAVRGPEEREGLSKIMEANVQQDILDRILLDFEHGVNRGPVDPKTQDYGTEEEEDDVLY